MPAKKEVAIIGAGPAGLITGSILKKSGLAVTIFEQRECLGGTWAIQPLSERVDIRNGLSGIYSPTYPSLRCNEPKQTMALPDYPFPDNFPYYPGHSEVLALLHGFTAHNKLLPLIRFNHRFESLAPVSGSKPERRWKVKTNQGEAIFDGVVLCNGRFFYPMLPDIEPLQSFCGRLEHSFSYRSPEVYREQRIAVMGTGPSGEDLSREISHCASRVFLCAHPGSREIHKPDWGHYGAHNNITRHQHIVGCDGHTVILSNGERLNNIDVILLCTGYHPDPVLQNALPDTGLSGNQYYITPLYLNLFHPQYPELAVTGMDLVSAPFVLYRYQAEVIARYLTGQIHLPSVAQRQFAAKQQSLRTSGKVNFSLRRKASLKHLGRLATMVGFESPAEKLIKVFAKSRERRRSNPNQYRDIPWEDEDRTH